MAIDAKHPRYVKREKDWVQLEDTLAGERAVKDKGREYLPPTSGMLLDGMEPNQLGYQAYQAYLMRAVFHDILKDAVDGMVGIMHRQPAQIELPDRMKPLLENATNEGETMQQLLMRINRAQLEYGRIGLLLEVPDGLAAGDVLPYFVTYSAARIINWDTGIRKQGRRELELVVLDESEYKRVSGLEWSEVTRFRVLTRSNQIDRFFDDDQDLPAGGVYVVATTSDKTVDMPPPEAFVAPSIGGVYFDQIPFAFINANDLAPEPDIPPLLGLSNLSLAIYRGEADYRQALYAQAQETLVTIGMGEEDTENESRVGASSAIHLPIGGDAKFIGVSGSGLTEMRHSLENDKTAATQRGARLLTAKGGDRQSGEALRVRVAAQTATLTGLAKTAAYGLELLLKQAAEVMGLDPAEVKVTPNLDFTDDTLVGRDLLEYMQAKAMGAPISRQSIHALMKERGVTKLDFETEMALLDSEDPLLGASGNARGEPGLSGDAGPGGADNV